MSKVLIVDDDPIQLRLTAEIAEKAGFATITAASGREALTHLRGRRSVGAVVLDLVMPDLDGMAVLEAMAQEGLSTPVIVQTAHSSLETVVTAMRKGACDFFVKPVAPERLIISLRNALTLAELENSLRRERDRRAGLMEFADIITISPTMDRVLSLARKAASSNIPVLVEGETGVGKELVARAIQGGGDRAGKPFVTVNCGAIPPNLVESVLFGHVKGAFTGAVTDHQGKFVEAHGGTLFLDEIGELPPEAQVKVLRALQDGEIEPVGGPRARRVDVRVISATNRRLLNLASAGRFREDLFYRLNVFPVYVPPLRDRREDIPALTAHFVARLGAEAGRRVLGVSPAALDLLRGYDWPGNVRQLENAVYRAVVLAESAWLEPADFPQIVAARDGLAEARHLAGTLPPPPPPVHIDALPLSRGPAREPAAPDRFVAETGEVPALADIERDLIAFALERYDGQMSKAARALGIGRSTLYRKLKAYGLEPAGAAMAEDAA